MNFPHWAPTILVELYEHYHLRRGFPCAEYPVKAFDPEQHIAQLLKENEKFKQMSKQRQENYRASLYQSEFGLSEQEGKELLGLPPV